MGQLVETKGSKVSFVIPTLNEENRIADCIEAIKPQLEAGDEIIVVDNGSKDKTNQIAEELGCRIVFESKKGISNARNAGAHAAQGDILCFIDADGKVHRDWLAEARSSLSDPRICAVSGFNYFASQDQMKRYWYNTYTAVAYANVLILDRLFRWTFLVGNNMAIRKEVFEDLGGFESVIGEDAWLSHNFGKKRELMGRGRVNHRMMVELSSRRFDQKGYARTIFGSWLVGMVFRISQEDRYHPLKNR